MWNNIRKLYYVKHNQEYFKDRYDFLILPDAQCKANPPFLVILVTTTHDQFSSRMVIRKTWGKMRYIRNRRIVTYFLLGTTANLAYQSSLLNENAQYGDLLQMNFTDTYHNLTLKTVLAMKWVHHFCSSSSFVMKTDTDMFVNVFYLMKLLLWKNRTSNFVTGFLKRNEKPIRTQKSKWYISRDEYPLDIYPTFCSGTGYVLSTDVTSKIYNVSHTVPIISLEDVYVGLCLAKLNIIPEALYIKDVFFPDKLEFSVCKFRSIVTAHSVTSSELLHYWKELVKYKGMVCNS